jgi:two-component system chemotaxis response regulator CheY
MFGPDTKTLVVDDFKTMRKLVSRALSQCGIKGSIEADDGATAWPLIEAAIAESKPFNLIVSDWNMPNLKGIDLLKKVRATEAIKNTPFILLTAEAEQANIMEAIKSGVSGYIIKPFNQEGFQEKLLGAYKKHFPVT